MLHSMNRGGAETMIMNYYRHIDREQLPVNSNEQICVNTHKIVMDIKNIVI